MKTLDLKKQWKHLFAASPRRPSIVSVPSLRYLMIDGVIPPGESPGTSAAFQQAISALYGVAFTVKFISKLRAKNPINFPVMALEGLWWTPSGMFDIARREEPWHWTLMIMQPPHVTKVLVRQAVAGLQKKRPNPALPLVRLASLREGICVQVMHIGPYADEPRTLEAMKVFAADRGYDLTGKHHEIYLGDPRRVRPEKQRTILRHPVARRKRLVPARTAS